jgi:hypothetical protein
VLTFFDLQPVLPTEIQMCLATDVSSLQSSRSKLVEIALLLEHPGSAPLQSLLDLTLRCALRHRDLNRAVWMH